MRIRLGLGLAALGFLLVSSSHAAEKMIKFKDVPNNYWAAPAVYDLVKMGVTKGYPDGTFRGNKPISRYETASFLSKLTKALGGADLKDQLKSLKDEVAAMKKQGEDNRFYGSCGSDWRFGNIFSIRGGSREAVASYRLKLASQHKINDAASIQVNLDTMDYGYFDNGTTSTGGLLATQLLDVASKFKLDLSPLGLADPVNVLATYGPGPQQHLADPTKALPSEVGVTYMRPYTGLMVDTKWLGMDVSGGYLAPMMDHSGQVEQSRVTGTLGYNFQSVPMINQLKVETTGDYISTGMLSATDRNLRAALTLTAPLGQKVEASGKWGLGGSDQKAWMVAGEIKLNDLFDTGTVANIRVAKVGSNFIRQQFSALEFDFAGYDRFSRPLENATVNLGGEVTQNVGEGIKLIGKGDVRLNGDYQYTAPKGKLTAQGGVSYAIAPNASLDALYRVEQDRTTKDTSDLAALGLMYQF